MTYQGFLSASVQILLQHVDDKNGGAFGLQCGKQDDQSVGGCAAIFDKRGEGSFHPRLQVRIGV